MSNDDIERKNETWNHKVLREHIRQHSEDPRLALHLLSSVGRVTEIFSFHLYTARDAFNNIVNTENAHDIENLKLIFGGSSNQEEFELARLISEAHLAACVHTSRNMFDLFSQLTNALIVFPRIPIEACNLHRLRNKLEPSELKELLTKLTDSSCFRYIDALNNTSKHRLIVNHALTVSNQEEKVGATVGEFEYGGKLFPKRWVRDVLSDALEVKNSIIGCGNALNQTYIQKVALLD
ncbi:MAG: hypothetical protein R3F22_02160 [Lysobacteraceae bacterium]